MESNNDDGQKRLVKSKADARFTLDILLQEADRENLKSGISTLLCKLENPRVNALFERYPDLLQEYGAEEMLTGNIAISGTSAHEIKTAGLLSCLQATLLFCAELKAYPNADEQYKDMLEYLLRSIACEDFIREMLLMVVGVVGADYYAIFRKKIDALGVGPEEIYSLENDPELQEHLDLMTWFCLVRLFLESVYVYFEIDNP